MPKAQVSPLLSANAAYKIMKKKKIPLKQKKKTSHQVKPFAVSSVSINKSLDLLNVNLNKTNKNLDKKKKKRKRTSEIYLSQNETDQHELMNYEDSALRKGKRKIHHNNIENTSQLLREEDQISSSEEFDIHSPQRVSVSTNYFGSSFPNAASESSDEDQYTLKSTPQKRVSEEYKTSQMRIERGAKKNKERSTGTTTYRAFTKIIRRNMSEHLDSAKVGFKLFQFILGSTKVEDFFKNYWEKKHLLVKGEKRIKFRGLFSTQELDDLLRENFISFGKNIDVTSYKNGQRETLNPVGRALASVVWDFYNSGCSVRLLNPQTFCLSVWEFLTTLQEYFNSFCGANVYLTPPGTQGFAPHWDDIEAFILQLEGKKRWRVYEPRNENETLPRNSSPNFGPTDSLGDPILDCVLEPGDMLYFPRGFIHQGEALDTHHSLHLTLSTYQKNSWVDLLEKVLPAALSHAAENDVEFRKGLPRGYLRHGGIAFSEKKSKIRSQIFTKVTELVHRMLTDAPIDAAIDQLAKGFIHDSLPPFLTESESFKSVFEGGEHWCPESKSVVNDDELEPEDTIRLLRRSCLRLVVEEDSIRLYYSIENSREYHEYEPAYLEIDSDIAPGVEFLVNSYPHFVAIEDLPMETLEKKMVLATALWEKGIILRETEPSEET